MVLSSELPEADKAYFEGRYDVAVFRSPAFNLGRKATYGALSSAYLPARGCSSLTVITHSSGGRESHQGFGISR